MWLRLILLTWVWTVDTADVTRVDSGGNFGADDIFIRAFDKEGRSLGEIKLADAITAGRTITATPTLSRNFEIRRNLVGSSLSESMKPTHKCFCST